MCLCMLCLFVCVCECSHFKICKTFWACSRVIFFCCKVDCTVKMFCCVACRVCVCSQGFACMHESACVLIQSHGVCVCVCECECACAVYVHAVCVYAFKTLWLCMLCHCLCFHCVFFFYELVRLVVQLFIFFFVIEVLSDRFFYFFLFSCLIVFRVRYVHCFDFFFFVGHFWLISDFALCCFLLLYYYVFDPWFICAKSFFFFFTLHVRFCTLFFAYFLGCLFCLFDYPFLSCLIFFSRVSLWQSMLIRIIFDITMLI
jgi:hypothetical protein